MGKISYKIKKGIVIITNSITEPERVVEQKHRDITANKIDCLLPLNIYKKRKRTILECKVENLMTLSQYFGGIVSKQAFLDLVLKLIEIIQKCEEQGFDPKNLALDNDMIFIDSENKSIKCVCWPIVNNKNDASVFEYFKQLRYSLSFNPFEDNGYLDDYREFFEAQQLFSINNFKKMVLQLSGKKVDKPNTGPSARRDNSEKKKVATGVKREYDPSADVDDFSYESNSDVGTVDMRLIIKGTVKLNQESSISPFLIRNKNQERFKIKSNIVVVGRSSSADLVIKDNDYIGREHAKLIISNERYYLIDCHSTNKTYIDGEEILPDKKYEIFNGTVIRFANEDFLFSIET